MSEPLKVDNTKSIGNACFRLYNRFEICLPIEDWMFMCENRWFTNDPDTADVEAEFGVCGAREAGSEKEANEIVQKTVNTYKRIMSRDITEDCRELLSSTSKTVAKMDRNGNICFEEAED